MNYGYGDFELQMHEFRIPLNSEIQREKTKTNGEIKMCPVNELRLWFGTSIFCRRHEEWHVSSDESKYLRVFVNQKFGKSRRLRKT